MRHATNIALLATLVSSAACSADDTARSTPGTGEAIGTTSQPLTGPMMELRHNHALVTITGTGPHAGKVLAVGQSPVTMGGPTIIPPLTELYDEGLGTWEGAGNLNVARTGAVVAGITGGDVIIAAGSTVASVTGSVELWSSTTATWTELGALTTARLGAAGAGLRTGPNAGWLLVAGGCASSTCNPSLSTAELFDPSDSSPTGANPMGTQRGHHSAVRIEFGAHAGKVLVTGGVDASSTHSTAEVFDPTTGNWTPTSNDMAEPRSYHRSVALTDGRALVCGGLFNFTALDTCDLYDPATNAFTAAKVMDEARWAHVMVRLPSGKVLVATGGLTATGALTTAELYDPATDVWEAATEVEHARVQAAEAVLPSGSILIAGGASSAQGPSAILGFRSTAEIYDQLADGSTCSLNSNCQSGWCVDNVCCDSECTGICRACSAAAKGTGADGVCGDIAPGNDPDNDCSAQDPTTCGRDGWCDGAGACRLHDNQTTCGGTPTCAGNTSIGGDVCDGAGTCVSQGTTVCTPYLCDTGSGLCAASCASDTQCAQGNYCSATSTCVTQLVAGDSCSRAGECASGFCVDGVCCDTACSATCTACTAAIKGAGSDGSCGPIAEGTDPDTECAEQPSSSCGNDGFCDGSGGCRKHSNTTPCGPTTCTNDPGGTSSTAGDLCNGSGACATGVGAVSCGLYRCAGDACAQTCTSASECIDGAFCDDGTCALEKDPGEACDGAAECNSGFCRDGVCCDDACTGQCEACDVSGAEGTCSPVNGAPHGNRPQCIDNGDECAGSCTGDRSQCSYPSSAQACGTPTCTAGTATASTCDGQGTCVEGQGVPCAPFACGGEACLDTCTSDADCAQGNLCDTASGNCVPPGGTCLDELTFESATGEVSSCAPYVCENNRCRTNCSTTTDCASGNLCDEGTCLAAETDADSGDEGGCGCRTPRRSPSMPAVLALLPLLAAIRRRARRATG